MRDRYDPRYQNNYDEYDYDEYDHLMDDVDRLLEEDAYLGPQNDPYDPYETYTPDHGEYQQPPQPSIYAYNADFQPRQKRPKPRPKDPNSYAGQHAERVSRGNKPRSKPPVRQDRRHEAPDSRRNAPARHREAPAPRRKKRHPILKLLLILILLVGIASAALWIFAKQPMTDQPIGARKDGAATILLAGTDMDGTRTDTMMLLHLNTNTGEANLMSLPRDTYTSANMSVPKLNGIYGLSGGGEEGMDDLLDYVQQCIGYRPDGYILVDLDCFESLVNIMGGVRFDVPMDMTYEDPAQDLYIDLKAGEQKLNGKEAMWVVRYRSGYALADLQRVQVQRAFVNAAIDQWSSPTKIFRYPAAAMLLASNTTTDLSLRNLVWIGKAALTADNGMQMETLPGEAAMISGGSYYVIWPESTATLINESFNPYEVYITKDMIYSPWY